jgi:UDP-GlcNAc:undecaprenyl-phosphate GlcNAc-1-phosphate transferase
MLTLIALLVASFLIAYTATPLIRNFALRRGWVDVPDGARKLHDRPIPRVGGIAVMLAYVVMLGVLAIARPHALDDNALALRWVWRLLPGAAVVFATGLLDDLYSLRPWQKLAGELTAAALACAVGVRITAIGGAGIPAWAGVLLTFSWLILCTNAFNLIDGLDGLASGVGLFATLTVLTAGLLDGDLRLVLATAPLAGALTGFLRYNLNPATVFLGDAGSLSVGFLLGCFGVVWSYKASTMVGMTGPLMAMAVPLCDTAVAVARRFLRSKPIFGADRAHIHHRLLDLGLTPKRVVLLLYGASGLAACFALVESSVSTEWHGIVFLLFVAAAWAGIHRLDYHEFHAVGEILRLRLLRGLLNDHLRLRSLEESLSGARTPDDYWRAVRDAAREFGFNSIELELHGRTYTEALQNGGNSGWTVRVPLQGSGYVRLTRESQGSGSSVRVASFLDFLHSSLGQTAGGGARGEQTAAAAAFADSSPAGNSDVDSGGTGRHPLGNFF